MYSRSIEHVALFCQTNNHQEPKQKTQGVRQSEVKAEPEGRGRRVAARAQGVFC